MGLHGSRICELIVISRVTLLWQMLGVISSATKNNCLVSVFERASSEKFERNSRWREDSLTLSFSKF
jgi:hypothetical protein